LAIAFCAAFSAYFYLLFKLNIQPTTFDLSLRETFILAFLLRGVLVFTLPHLSDDIYRFIWDGQLINSGINPFNHPPQYFADNQLFTDRLSFYLFDKINSKVYHTIYPPVVQGIFALAAWLFPHNHYGAVIIIKSFLFLCEIGTLYLITQLCQSFKLWQSSHSQNSHYSFLLYALNPLIIIEFCGNGHLEAAMIFFFFLSLNFIKNKKIAYSAIAMSLAIATKLIPVLFILPLFKRLIFRGLLKYSSIIGICLLLLFLPLYNAVFIENISKSLNLYFQKFEFNASLYYLISRPIEWIKGYNPIQQIAPMLSFLTAFSMLFVAFLEKTKASLEDFQWESYFEKCLFIISIYFLTATTVHPWYATIPFALSIFTRWRYPLVWSLMILVTYHGYTLGTWRHTENFWLIGLEYGVVFYVFIKEYRRHYD
jgi:hypothetical protein